MRPPTRLTPHQEEAVNQDGSRILLVASAGSGKTEVLTRRVMRHLTTSAGQTFRVLAVTFTVRAAQELQSRLQASASSEAWRVDADTVHGFALDWLMRFGQSVNVYPDTVVYAEDADRLNLLANFVTSLGEPADIDLRPVLRAIDDHRLSAGGMPVGPRVGSVLFSDLYDGYLTALDAANGIDFAGMLTKFIEASAADPRFLENFWSTYRHVLVDEGQDLSRAQAEVLDRLASPPVDLFVVADDRQSINGFAGGSFANVRRLVGESAVARALQLPHNFRCATSVLHAAELVAAHLRDRPPPALAVANAPAGLVRVLAASSPDDEGELVAEWVLGLLENGLEQSNLAEGEDPTVSPEEIAVIARARWLLDPVVAALLDREIEVSIQTDTQSLLATPPGRVLLEGVGIAAATENAPAVRRLIDELSGAGVVVADEQLDVVQILRASGLTDLARVGDALDGLDVDNIEERLNALQNAATDSGWLDDVRVITSLWANYAIAVPHHRRDLSGFVRHAGRAQQTRPSDPGVRVLTIHKVKGLEFKAVCLIGAYNGVLPDRRANTAEAIDEERRAFYVAMTRASRELLVTYPQATMDRYGRTHHQAPSTFAVEAGLT